MSDEHPTEKQTASQRRRSRIQQSIDAAEEQRKRELFRKRIELARLGLQNYDRKKVVEAVRAFHTYIRILEDWKDVSEGQLSPSLFDLQKDLPELLLISGVYWDLAKLYDRTKSTTKQTDFAHYLDKFVIFSKGMPFQPLAVETLRKYISHQKPVHNDQFQNAFKALGGGQKCFVATALFDVCDPETIARLRRFRGEVLMKSKPGRVFVRAYYRVGPSLARVTDRAPKRLRMIAGHALDRIALAIDRRGD